MFSRKLWSIKNRMSSTCTKRNLSDTLNTLGCSKRGVAPNKDLRVCDGHTMNHQPLHPSGLLHEPGVPSSRCLPRLHLRGGTTGTSQSLPVMVRYAGCKHVSSTFQEGRFSGYKSVSAQPLKFTFRDSGLSPPRPHEFGRRRTDHLC